MNESKFLGVWLYTICDSIRVYEIYAPEIPQEYCYNLALYDINEKWFFTSAKEIGEVL